MFTQQEILTAAYGGIKQGKPIRLSSYEVNGYKSASIQMSRAALGPLLKYAEVAYSALDQASQHAAIDPNETNPQAKLNQKVLFVIENAPDFLAQTGSPYIIDKLPQSKKDKAVRLMGFEDENGLYNKTESDSPQKDLFSLMKMSFNKDFVNFANTVKAELEKEGAGRDVYEARVKAFMAKKDIKPENAKKAPEVTLGIGS